MGLEAEKIVALHFTAKGYRVFRERWRTPFAELDLVFQKGDRLGELLVVECKRRTHPDFRDSVLTFRQRRRLMRAISWLNDRGFHCELRLVIVNQQGQIEEFSDVFS